MEEELFCLPDSSGLLVNLKKLKSHLWQRERKREGGDGWKKRRSEKKEEGRLVKFMDEK